MDDRRARGLERLRGRFHGLRTPSCAARASDGTGLDSQACRLRDGPSVLGRGGHHVDRPGQPASRAWRRGRPAPRASSLKRRGPRRRPGRSPVRARSSTARTLRATRSGSEVGTGQKGDAAAARTGQHEEILRQALEPVDVLPDAPRRRLELRRLATAGQASSISSPSVEASERGDSDQPYAAVRGTSAFGPGLQRPRATRANPCRPEYTRTKRDC